MKQGDKFVIIGAVTGQVYNMTVQALTRTDYHEAGGKKSEMNVTATNDEHGGKAVFALNELVRRKAEMVAHG